jgi:hypothetical protein
MTDRLDHLDYNKLSFVIDTFVDKYTQEGNGISRDRVVELVGAAL